jgi:chorismate mutase
MAAVPQMPAPVHSTEEQLAWLGAQVEPVDPNAAPREVWVAEQDGSLVGFFILEEGWLHSIYVQPGRTGEGIGTLMLEVAKSLRPGGLQLWVFQTNEPARRWYARQGFSDVEHTDGSSNEERAPDVRMVWTGAADLGDLRDRIDELDDQLAALLALRAHLTSEIQRLKEVPGHAGRDPRREAEIVARMARIAPRLGPDRLARIMDAVITAGLDVAGHPELSVGPASIDPSRHVG